MTSSMAEVSFLRLPEISEAVEQEEIFAFDSSFPFCSLVFTSDSDPASIDDDNNNIHQSGAFDPEIYNRIGSGSGSFEEIQVTSAVDLFQQRVAQSHSHLLEIGSFESIPNFGHDFGAFDRNSDEFGANLVELEEEDPLGLGTIFDTNPNLIHFASDSDSEEEVDDLQEADSFSDDENRSCIPLPWDSLQLEDNIHGNDDFEWEEVDAVEDDQQASRSLEWQVLLNEGRNIEIEYNEGFHFGGHDDDLTAEYEMTIGQFTEGENPSICRPPASKLAVESLPSVTMTDEDVCVVCKDDMSVGENVKQLPCSHRYHGECIIPWLGISNTCPVCRGELPTDDIDYEQRKERRARTQ